MVKVNEFIGGRVEGWRGGLGAMIGLWLIYFGVLAL